MRELLACEKKCQLSLIKALVDLGARVNTLNADKMNSLYSYVRSACWHGGSIQSFDMVAVIQFLLDAGADTDVLSYTGKTVLMLAAHHQLYRIINTLKQHHHRKILDMQSRLQD